MPRSRKYSIESFISPAAQTIESSAGPVSSGIRPLRSLSLAQKDEVFVTRTAPVNVRSKGLARWTWPRQYLRLTNHTLSLHRNHDSDALEIIVLRKVVHVERVNVKSHCLRIETTDGKHHFFAFDSDVELYAWLTDIHMAVSPVGKPTDFKRLIHVETDKNDRSRLIGLPENWKDVSSLVHRDSSIAHETALPALSSASALEPIIDIKASLPLSRSVSPDAQLNEGDEGLDIILTANLVTRLTTQLLNTNPEIQPPKIIIDDSLVQPTINPGLHTASEDSPSKPLLTPDTTPMTPFRESPYREMDAKDLSGHIHKQSQRADAHGGYVHIWRAQWQSENGVYCPVAVKVLRVLSQDEDIQSKIQRRLRHEVRVWHQLRHKHVVQMYGTCDGFGPFSSMVSPWYENGNVNVYLRKLGDAGTVERRLKLLTEAAAGLNYLHNFFFEVVHGDLKGANILVNDRGEAVLADFGLSSIINIAGSSGTSTFTGGSVRWMAPELLALSLHDVTPRTCASDTYSYGSVILEILTGERPYKHIQSDIQVINQLIQGYKPMRPLKPTLNPGVWDLMERCWNTDIAERPSMSLVLSRMENFYSERRKLMLPEDKVAYAS